MGQGGRIEFVNTTKYDWKKTVMESNGMNWTWPMDVLNARHKYRLYVEFVKPPYAANLRWAFHPSEGVEHAFRINVNGEYNISIQNESVPFSNLKTTGTMNVQWLEDQVMIITLSEDPNDASKYNINLTSFNSKDSRFDHLLLPVE